MQHTYQILAAVLLLLSPAFGWAETNQPSEADIAAAKRLADQRQSLDNTVWAPELKAGKHERSIIQLWDQLRKAADPLRELAKYPLRALSVGEAVSSQSHELGIREIQLGAPYQEYQRADFQKLVERFHKQGFRLEETEWHHSAFRQEGDAARSLVDFVLHVLHKLDANDQRKQARLVIRGKLQIEWLADDSASAPRANTITVKDLKILTRIGPPAFERVFTYERRPQDVASAHPILLHDLDKNGYPEIIVSRWNRVYWNQGRGRFEERTLQENPIPLAEAGIVGDFTDDGRADLISINKLGQLVVLEGDSQGFNKPRIVSSTRMPAALSMTAGDIDQDGDLDVWVSQYKPAYLEGQMPTPYYDANDGEPAFLLVNNGQCQFEDQTAAAGFKSKRNRRTYSSSFFDYDGDRDLDLVVVSDYAGVDLYENRGDGKFRDVTDSRLSDNRHLFGMSHTFSDYDGNGELDIYAIGMSSTTARRLDSLKLQRSRNDKIAKMRAAMGFGNRVFSWQSSKFATPTFFRDLARTGWSWGVTSFDYDLDGDEDTYVANGFRSGDSCQDYCSTFWRHDIYTGDSKPNQGIAQLFAKNMQSLNQGQTSWNGYEHNALFQNLDHQSYKNIGYLMGVGCEFDARAVIGNDLDGDGRPDLIISEYELVPGRGYIMKLHVYRNLLPTKNNWVGIRLPESGGHAGLFGTTAELHTGDRKQVRQYTCGDSFLSQHDNVFHFGIGNAKEVDKVVIRWPNGTERTLAKPAINTYHAVTPAD